MAEKSADRKFCDNRDYGNIHIKLAFGLFIASVAIQGIGSLTQTMAPQYFDLTGFGQLSIGVKNTMVLWCVPLTELYRFLKELH